MFIGLKDVHRTAGDMHRTRLAVHTHACHSACWTSHPASLVTRTPVCLLLPPLLFLLFSFFFLLLLFPSFFFLLFFFFPSSLPSFSSSSFLIKLNVFMFYFCWQFQGLLDSREEPSSELDSSQRVLAREKGA